MIMFPSLILRAFKFIIIIIMNDNDNDNDGNIERFLACWKYCNLCYFYTIDFFNLYIFLSDFRTKGYNNVLTMS